MNHNNCTKKIISLLFFTAFIILQSAFSQEHIETGFLDRYVTYNGSTYHYQVYIPATYTPSMNWPVILFLHGAGERGSDGLLQTASSLGAAIRRNPSRYPAIVVFPQAPSDSIWVGTTAYFAIAALDTTLKEFKTDSNRIYLTGLSMGGNGTWYLAYRYPKKFAAVVPICGWVTPFNAWSREYESVVPKDIDNPLQHLVRRLSTVPIWIAHGEEDDAVPVEKSREIAETLTRENPNSLYTELHGLGHVCWDAIYGSTKFATWLFAQRK